MRAVFLLRRPVLSACLRRFGRQVGESTNARHDGSRTGKTHNADDERHPDPDARHAEEHPPSSQLGDPDPDARHPGPDERRTHQK
jgi:hypothetical protein